MKRLFAILIALLLCSCALAEGLDLASMTDDDIYTLIDTAHSEIERRGLLGNTENVTVFDEQGITIVFSSFDVDPDNWLYKPALVAKGKVVNTSGNDMAIYIDNVAINGWEVESMGMVDIQAGHKEKEEFQFKLEDADVTALDELETMELTFHYKDPETGKYVYTEPVTINFK